MATRKFIGEGGGEWVIDVPLSENYAYQYGKGYLRLAPGELPFEDAAEPVQSHAAGTVDPDGKIVGRLDAGDVQPEHRGGDPEPLTEAGDVANANPKLGSLERPAKTDPVADWRAYAAQVSDLSSDELAGTSKATLIERFGG